MTVKIIPLKIGHNKQRFIALFFLVLFISGLAGCGKTGALYLLNEKATDGQIKNSYIPKALWN